MLTFLDVEADLDLELRFGLSFIELDRFVTATRLFVLARSILTELVPFLDLADGFVLFTAVPLLIVLLEFRDVSVFLFVTGFLLVTDLFLAVNSLCVRPLSFVDMSLRFELRMFVLLRIEAFFLLGFALAYELSR